MQRKLVDVLGRSSQALTSRAFIIGQNTLEFVVNLFVMLYLLFFLLRDGKALAAQAARALPLKPQHTRRLLNQFATVVRATVKGNVVVALVQGTLGGLAFWVLGINGAAAVGRTDGAAFAVAGGGRRHGLGPGGAVPAVHRLDLVGRRASRSGACW